MDDDPVDNLLIVRQAVDQMMPMFGEIMPCCKAAYDAAQADGFSAADSLAFALEVFRTAMGK